MSENNRVASVRWVVFALVSPPLLTSVATFLHYLGNRWGWYALYGRDGLPTMPIWIDLTALGVFLLPSAGAASMLARRALLGRPHRVHPVTVALLSALAVAIAVLVLGAVSAAANLFVACSMGDCL